MKYVVGTCLMVAAFLIPLADLDATGPVAGLVTLTLAAVSAALLCWGFFLEESRVIREDGSNNGSASPVTVQDSGLKHR